MIHDWVVIELVEVCLIFVSYEQLEYQMKKYVECLLGKSYQLKHQMGKEEHHFLEWAELGVERIK